LSGSQGHFQQEGRHGHWRLHTPDAGISQGLLPPALTQCESRNANRKNMGGDDDDGTHPPGAGAKLRDNPRGDFTL
jgi:hypothetical protein